MNIGKMKKKNSNLQYKKKKQILYKTKNFVIKNGWSSKIIEELKNKNVKSEDLILLFPNGYKSLLNFSLEELNLEVENKIKKNNIINFPLSKRIRKIILTRFELMDENKKFYKRTFFYLILPHNSKIMKKNLYKTIDDIWYMAGDNSTDFSYYTKRIILSLIYISALFVFYNKSIEETKINLDKNLNKISKIPKIKNKLSVLKDNFPIFLRGLIS